MALLDDVNDLRAKVATRKTEIRSDIKKLQEELRELEKASPAPRKREPKPKPEKKAKA